MTPVKGEGAKWENVFVNFKTENDVIEGMELSLTQMKIWKLILDWKGIQHYEKVTYDIQNDLSSKCQDNEGYV